MRFTQLFLTPLLLCLALALPANRISAQSQTPIPQQLELSTAIIYALENNFAIRQAQQRIREQEGLIITVKANVLPEATLNANYTERDAALSEPNGFFEPITANWNVNVQIRQAVYSGGKLLVALGSQKLEEEAALLDLQGVINQALLETRTRFYDVLLARDQITVEEQNIRLLEEQLQDAKNRYEAGSVSNFSVLRAEVELANAQPAFIRSKSRYRTAIDALRQSLGYVNDNPLEVGTIPEFVGELKYEPIEFDLPAALGNGRTRRPDLLRLEKIALSRAMLIKVEKAANRPDVDLVAGYQANRSFPSSSVSDSLKGWTLGLQTNWNIFDGHARHGRIVQAKARLDQADLDFKSQRLAVEVEIRQAYSNFEEAKQLVAAAAKVSDQAEEALRLADARYSAGDGTQLDILQTRVALTQARTNQLEANYSYNVAVAKLHQATGQPDVVIQK